MIAKKVIVCDLDGTLTESKSTLSQSMAEVLCQILSKHFLVVISGGTFSQFQKQFLSQLSCGPELLQNLYLFPTMGGACYTYDLASLNWKEIYNEELSLSERKEIVKALNQAMLESGLDFTSSYGDIIEDRGSQVTFSGRGQQAPIDMKKTWDPDKSKRRLIIKLLKKKIPQFEINIGGITSIDITKKGIDKAYAISKIKELLNVTDDDVIFVGDALYKGGNDAPVKKTDVDFIQQSGPDETIELLKQYI